LLAVGFALIYTTKILFLSKGFSNICFSASWSANPTIDRLSLLRGSKVDAPSVEAFTLWKVAFRFFDAQIRSKFSSKPRSEK
jgi:hypothetical protein